MFARMGVLPVPCPCSTSAQGSGSAAAHVHSENTQCKPNGSSFCHTVFASPGCVQSLSLSPLACLPMAPRNTFPHPPCIIHRPCASACPSTILRTLSMGRPVAVARQTPSKARQVVVPLTRTHACPPDRPHSQHPGRSWVARWPPAICAARPARRRHVTRSDEPPRASPSARRSELARRTQRGEGGGRRTARCRGGERTADREYAPIILVLATAHAHA